MADYHACYWLGVGYSWLNHYSLWGSSRTLDASKAEKTPIKLTFSDVDCIKSEHSLVQAALSSSSSRSRGYFHRIAVTSSDYRCNSLQLFELDRLFSRFSISEAVDISVRLTCLTITFAVNIHDST